ncbi:hypothetical protein BaRGS_00002554 [Batillaria attramentaria]|uniref:Uncharacterized protein n=1 Tax=Batillaria attramentaria TaxID=370345 RepID=A0ABD0M592_9CAEN
MSTKHNPIVTATFSFVYFNPRPHCDASLSALAAPPVAMTSVSRARLIIPTGTLVFCDWLQVSDDHTRPCIPRVEGRPREVTTAVHSSYRPATDWRDSQKL